MTKLKQLIAEYERETNIVFRVGLLGQMMKEIQKLTKEISRKV